MIPWLAGEQNTSITRAMGLAKNGSAFDVRKTQGRVGVDGLERTRPPSLWGLEPSQGRMRSWVCCSCRPCPHPVVTGEIQCCAGGLLEGGNQDASGPLRVL